MRTYRIYYKQNSGRIDITAYSCDDAVAMFRLNYPTLIFEKIECILA